MHWAFEESPLYPSLVVARILMSASMVLSDHFVLCKAALIFAVTRWLLSFALNLLNSMSLFSASSDSLAQASSRRNPSSSANLKMVKDNLSSTTFGNIQHRLPENCDMSCAVCLNQLRKKSQVWELRNCRHVFHKHCLEKWLSYDGCRLTCPLCRASLQPTPLPEPQHWAVEHTLYLFGDDLLP